MSANPVKMTRTATVVEGLDLTVFTWELLHLEEHVKKVLCLRVKKFFVGAAAHGWPKRDLRGRPSTESGYVAGSLPSSAPKTFYSKTKDFFNVLSRLGNDSQT